jgi:hypothetical protein
VRARRPARWPHGARRGSRDATEEDPAPGDASTTEADAASDGPPDVTEAAPDDSAPPHLDGSLADASSDAAEASIDAPEESPPPPPIAFVQEAASTPNDTTTSVSAKFGQAQTAGDLIVVAIGWDDATAAVSTVTDTAGNTYTLAIGPTSYAPDLSQSIYYAPNIAAAAANTNTVKVTFVESANDPDLRVLEYSGLDTASPLDQTADGQAKSTGPATTSAVTTKAARELLFVAGMTDDLYSGAGTGFTSRLVTSEGDIVEDRVVTATGSYSGTADLPESCEWLVQMATFRQ